MEGRCGQAPGGRVTECEALNYGLTGEAGRGSCRDRGTWLEAVAALEQGSRGRRGEGEAGGTSREFELAAGTKARTRGRKEGGVQGDWNIDRALFKQIETNGSRRG